MSISSDRDPEQSPLSMHSNRNLLIKMLAEMRLQTIIMAETSGFRDNIATLRDEIMSRANKSATDV